MNTTQQNITSSVVCCACCGGFTKQHLVEPPKDLIPLSSIPNLSLPIRNPSAKFICSICLQQNSNAASSNLSSEDVSKLHLGPCSLSLRQVTSARQRFPEPSTITEFGFTRENLPSLEKCLNSRLFSERVSALTWLETIVKTNKLAKDITSYIASLCFSLYLEDNEPSVRETAAKTLLSFTRKDISKTISGLISLNAIHRAMGDFSLSVRSISCLISTSFFNFGCNQTLIPHDSFQLKLFQSGSITNSKYPYFSTLLSIIRYEVTPTKRFLGPLLCSEITFSNNNHLSCDNNENIAILTLAWKSAIQCVNNKLKTHLGNPVQTFESLEKILIEASNPASETKLNIPLLLEFMDYLEKFTLNACESCPSGITQPANQAVTQFFITNSKVCKDWFIRLRIPKLKAAIKYKCWSHIIKITSQILQNSMPISEKSSYVMLLLAKSLSEMEDCDSLHSIYALYSQQQQPNIPIWLTPFVFSSSGNFESAITECKKVIIEASSTTTSSPSDLIITELQNSLIQWISKLGDWKSLDDLPFENHTKQDKVIAEILSSVKTSTPISSLSLRNQILNVHKFEIPLHSTIRQNLISKLFCVELAESLIQITTSSSSFQQKLNYFSSSIQNISEFSPVMELFEALHLNDSSKLKPFSNFFLKCSKIARKFKCNSFAERILARSEHFISIEEVNFEKIKLARSSGRLTTLQSIEILANIFHLNTKDFSIATLPNITSLLTLPQNQSQPQNLNLLAVILRLHKWYSNIGKINEAGNAAFYSVEQFRTSSKGWKCLGNWLYSQFKEIINQINSEGANKFSVVDIQELSSFLKVNYSLSNRNPFLEEICEMITNDIGRNESLNDHSYFKEFALKEDICQFVSKWDNTKQLNSDELFKTCERIERRILEPLCSSVVCFFRCLQTSDKNEENLQVSLQIIRILSHFGHIFPDNFKEGFAKTPLSPWKLFIPQLLSLIGHTNCITSNLSEELCIELSQEYPHNFVFPTLSVENEQGNDDVQNGNAHFLSLKKIAEDLERRNPSHIGSVKLVISELLRVSVLWEEKWIETIQKVGLMYSSLIRAANEAMKELTSEQQKSQTFMSVYQREIKPIIEILEKLFDQTSKPAETPHESDFQAMFSPAINHALKILSNPIPSCLSLDFYFAPFRDLCKQMIQRFKPRTEKLINLSPQLKNIKESGISLPVQTSNSINNSSESSFSPTNVITLHSFSEDVIVIQTKTKPKKISVIGSDGKSRSYLLKGNEDLRLDERVMQFLSVFNCIVATSIKHQSLRARNYAVTPISKNSGLIQWVDGAVPIFTIYKDWQKSSSKSNTNSDTNTANNKPTTVRPVDEFYAKIIPILNKMKINLTSRREWPKDILLTVFKELCSETPKNLLSQWMWFNSVTVPDFIQKEREYGQSLAVMSMIGFILGLGDRHLDNILVDIMTGEVIHIDYNICFGRGLLLRIPELVPFRLTQNIQNALGFLGMDGHFKRTSERVLDSLKKSSETLLSLLDTFIFDPLTDLFYSLDEDNKQDLYSSFQTFISQKEQIVEQISEISASFSQLKAIKDGEFSQYQTLSTERNQLIQQETIAGNLIKNLESKLQNISEIKTNRTLQLNSLQSEQISIDGRTLEIISALKRSQEANQKHCDSHLRVISALSSTDLNSLKEQISQISFVFLKCFITSDEVFLQVHSKFTFLVHSLSNILAQCIDCISNFVHLISTDSSNFICFHWSEVMKKLIIDFNFSEEAKNQINQAELILKQNQQQNSNLGDLLLKMNDLNSRISKTLQEFNSIHASRNVLEQQLLGFVESEPIRNSQRGIGNQCNEIHKELTDYCKTISSTFKEIFAIQECSQATSLLHNSNHELLTNAIKSNSNSKSVNTQILHLSSEIQSIIETSDQINKQIQSENSKIHSISQSQTSLNDKIIQNQQQIISKIQGVFVPNDVFVKQQKERISNLSELFGGVYLQIEKYWEQLPCSLCGLCLKLYSESKIILKSLLSLSSTFSNSKERFLFEVFESDFISMTNGIGIIEEGIQKLFRLISANLDNLKRETKQQHISSTQHRKYLQSNPKHIATVNVTEIHNSDEFEEEEDEDDDDSDHGISQPVVKMNREAISSVTRSIHALKMIRKITQKLETTSKTTTTKTTTTNQIDQLIKQATNPENLSQLYEGWTSWI